MAHASIRGVKESEMKLRHELQQKVTRENIALTPDQVKQLIITSREQGFLLALLFLGGKVRPV
jgi:hypothetical protein